MTDSTTDRLQRGDLIAGECPEGHLTCPPHLRCPECGRQQTKEHDLSDHIGEILTWTTSTAPPPGVREPNHVAIVVFEVGDRTVRSIGQLTTGDVEIGTEVRAIPVEHLRNPESGIREPESQSWAGYRFEPL